MSATGEGSLFHFETEGEPRLPCMVYLPAGWPEPRRLLVSVHGISRNRREHLTAFRGMADRHGVALLLPLFSRRRFRDFQRLGRRGRGPRADLALLRAIDEVRAMLGADFETIDLFGFSGGAQFAHRFALAHPGVAARLGLGAAGWYTWPDAALEYPLGLGPSEDMPGVRWRIEGLLERPVRLWVGERDRQRDSALNTRPAIDRLQGHDRVERAIHWVAALRNAALRAGRRADVRLELLPGVGHDFEEADRHGDLGRRLFSAFYGPITGETTT